MERGALLETLQRREVTGEEAAAHQAVVALLTDTPAPFSRSQELPGHLTASAIVVTDDWKAVLLVFHGALRRWLQPGGHVEAADADVDAAARREVEEETGIPGGELADVLGGVFDVDVHEIPARPARGEGVHRHFDVRRLYVVRSGRGLRAGDGVTEARWVPLDEVASLDTDASVLRCVDKVRALAEEMRGASGQQAPAAARNRAPIAQVLSRWVPGGARVLELACGTGEHAQHLSRALGARRWVPTDLSPAARRSTQAHRRADGVVEVPVFLDAATGLPPAHLEGGVDLVFAANLVHISARETLEGVARLASRALRPGGRLALYGPFHAAGRPTAESNAAFDDDLRRRDASWGVWPVEAVVATAARHDLAWLASEPMPANNLTLIFERRVAGVEAEAAALLLHWFGATRPPAPDRQRAWWSHDADEDARLRERFGALHARAAHGELDHWTGTPQGTLALILLLDQVSRQIHRGSAGMFATDAQAVRWSQQALARRDHLELGLHERLFLWMPFMHAEDRALQALAMGLFADLGEAGEAEGQPGFAQNLEFARRHRDIVERFGRFPHRNAVLGRRSTEEELAFLEQPGSSF